MRGWVMTPRGIEPPERPYGPPPTPDFGVVLKPEVESAPATVTSDHSDLPPQRSIRPWSVVAIAAAILGVLVLMILLVMAGVSSIVTLTGDRGEAGPSSEIDDSAQSDPAQGDDDAAPAAGSVETALQAKIDGYKSARSSGVLWATIDDTEYNRTAVSAFLYLLTDLKLAASFGADTSGYLARADELEQKLLAGEPLGSDISIKLSDRTFTYDGDTGEGGYTDN